MILVIHLIYAALFSFFYWLVPEIWDISLKMYFYPKNNSNDANMIKPVIKMRTIIDKNVPFLLFKLYDVVFIFNWFFPEICDFYFKKCICTQKSTPKLLIWLKTSIYMKPLIKKRFLFIIRIIQRFFIFFLYFPEIRDFSF